MNISEFVANLEDDDAKATDSTSKDEKKEKEDTKGKDSSGKKAKGAERNRKSEQFFSEKAQERATRKRLERDGLDLFFTNNNYVPAAPEDFEGHYPGNQNNVVLIPHQKRINHVSGK